MDRELIDFLDKKFTKIDKRFDKVDERFDKVDERFDKVEERLNKVEERLDKVDERFDKVDERFDKVDEQFAEMKHYTDEKFEDSKRYFGVWAEELRGEIRLVAEGHGVLQRQIENLDARVEACDRKIENIRIEIVGIKKEIAELRRDNEKSFKELLSAIKISYADLDHRMTSFEAELQALRQRVEQLEAR